MVVRPLRRLGPPLMRFFQRFMPWLWRLVFFVLFALAAVFAFREFPGLVNSQADGFSISSKRMRRYEPASGLLFEQMVCRGLLKVDMETLELRYPPADLRLRLSARDDRVKYWADAADEEGLALIEALHKEDVKPARAVREQISEWNSYQTLAAIRDDRNDGRAGADDWFPVTPEDEEPAWRAETVSAVAPDRLGYSLETYDGLSYFRYGFLGWGDDAPGGPWIRSWLAVPFGHLLRDGDLGRIRFVTRFPAGDRREITVDVVGRGPHVSGATELSRERKCAAKRIVTDRYDSEWTPVCAPGQVPDAYRLHIRPHSATADVAVVVEVHHAIAARRLRLAGARFQPKRCGEGRPAMAATDTAVERVGSIALICALGALDKVCRLDWDWRNEWRKAPSGSGGAVEPEEPQVLYRVVSSDNTDLTQENGSGRITAEAARIGLAPVVGLGREDFYGLSEDLSGRPDLLGYAIGEAGGRAQPPAFALTFDARLQDLALRVLTNHVKASPDGKRRAALVLLDAGDGPGRGRILAAATLPEYERPITAWNALGWDAWRPAASPLAPLAWARTDLHDTAGSTFKAVTAMALIREAVREGAKEGAPLLDAIRGIHEVRKNEDAPGLPLPPGVEVQDTGLKVPTSSTIIHNAADHRHRAGYVSPAITGCPPLGRDLKSRQYGLCEALSLSLNTWFMAAALSLDRDFLEQIGAGRKPALRSRLVNMAERVLDPRARDLAGLRPPQPDGKPPRSFDPRRYWMDGARMSLRSLDPADRKANPPFTLAQNGMGQGVTIAPAAVAALFASIASGCVVEPWISAQGPALASWGVDPQGGDCEPIFFDRDEDPYGDKEKQAQELMDVYLKAGLRSVVSSAVGTAGRHFRGDKVIGDRLYAKTGTAQTLNENTNTGWLAGWIEPPAGAEGVLGRRIAFACMASHMHGSGATACGPAIKALVHELSKLAAKGGGR